ncbi:MAG TPA: response regulator [Candidatus Desulfaltia sp.]|nr:response regulator [Candidatus Desulfaltia sp.]
MAKKEVLIVDDNIITQNMLKTALGNAGYGYIVASNGKEALELAAGRLPGVIILDIMMPDMDGGEVAEILKKNPRTKEIPIIFLSSLISKQEEKTGAKKDIVSFLSKPYNREMLLNEVRSYLYKGAD